MELPQEKKPRLENVEEEEEEEEEVVDGAAVDEADADVEEEEDDVQLRLIEEEHRVWKKNTPFLYDVCIKHDLKAGGLTCQWLPPKTSIQEEYSAHELLMGSKVPNDGSNFLSIIRVLLPNDSVDLTSKEFCDKTNELGGYAANVKKLDRIVDIKHDGDVNRARCMPSDHFMIATRMQMMVSVFKFDELSGKPKEDEPSKPMVQGIGHREEGYGLDWSRAVPEILLSCGGDATYLWNIDRSAAMIEPVQTYEGASDCAWSPHHDDLFVTVSLSGKITGLKGWDARTNGPAFCIESQEFGELNSVSMNPEKEGVFLTGGSNQVVQMWDSRKLKEPQHVFKGHAGEIYGIQWAPFKDSVFASCGDDRRVIIWDSTLIGKEQTPEEAEDGDPEMLFVHGGHCSRVTDLSWSPNDDWVIASIADNGDHGDLQIWQPAEHIYDDTASDAEEDLE